LEDVLYWVGGTTLSKNNLGRAPLDEHGQDRPGNSVTAPRPLSIFAIPSKLALKLNKRDGALFEKEIYSDFLLWAKDVFKGGFYGVAYDWRKGASMESRAQITKAIDEALCKSGRSKVILVAHSLGGIVARDYIASTEGKSVDTFIAVGTPWLGAPKTARALLWGYNFGAGLVFPSKRDVTIQGDAEDFAGNHYCRPDKEMRGYLCPYPARISFFKMEETTRLARNFPALYQQLPTREFMEKYGAFYAQDFRPVILGMKSWTEMENFYTNRDERKRGNEYLYTEAQRLRQRILNTGGPDNYGLRGPDKYHVDNYLIAGVYSPACGNPKEKGAKGCNLDDVMDMQMAGREKLRRSFPLKLRSLGLRALNLITRPLGFILTRQKFVLEEDRYVATDSDVDWGDGTAPLLSATAGEYLKGADEHRFPGAACDLLGEGTEVETVKLGPSYPHGSMLNDPQVRQKLLRIYSDQNGARGLDREPGKPGEVVASLKIDFFLKPIMPSAHIPRMTISFTNLSQEPITASIIGNKRSIILENPQVRDTSIVIPNVRHDETPLGILRSLRITDCPAVVLKLENESGDTLYFNRYTINVNGKPVYSSEQSFDLKTDPYRIDLKCQ
jgi:pimeloyl-ACP methyl ester carboxylesterase